METKVKFLGHSLHTMLVAFPLGLLTTAVVFDLVNFYTTDILWAQFSYLLIALGIATGAAAAIVGWADWFNIPKGTRARSMGLIHGIGNAMVLVLFAGSWWLRSSNIEAPVTAAYVLSFVGLVLAALTAWMGAELVQRMGVAIHPDANLNAPSSLIKSDGKKPVLTSKSDDSHQAA